MGDSKKGLGELEEKLLICLISAGGKTHGADIYSRLQAAGRTAPLGSIYVTLERLRDKGFIESEIEPPRDERGGRARKLYRIVGEGERALRENDLVRQRLTLRVEGSL